MPNGPAAAATRTAALTFSAALPFNAAFVECAPPERKKGQRGRCRPTARAARPAQRAGQPHGWQEVTCVQYGQTVTKRIKTFLATWRPAEA